MIDDVKVFLLASAICLSVIAGCKSKKPQASVNDETSALVQTIQTTPSFGTEQNDNEGYGDHSWGSRIAQGMQETEKSWNYNIFLKAVGPPGEVVNETFIESEDAAPPIQTYSDTVNRKTTYGYYDGQLAFVLVQLDGSYEDAQRSLGSKYAKSINFGQDGFGDGTVPGSAPGRWEGLNFTGAVYQRGKTNTRIYLMRSLDEDGTTSEVDLLYIPSKYLLAIRNAWWGEFNDKQRQALQKRQADADAARQKDQQAIQ